MPSTPRPYSEILSPPSSMPHTTPLFTTHAEQSNRLSTLEDNVRSLSMTLEDLKKALVGEKVSTSTVGHAVNVPMPRGRRTSGSGNSSSNASAANPRGRSTSRTRSSSLSKKPVSGQARTRSTSRPPKPAQPVLIPYVYTPEEEAAITERHSRSLRGVRMMTVQELTRLCDYVHPPTEVLPYVKILSLLLKLQKKDSWTRSDLRSDRKDLWGGSWKVLRPLLGTKQLTDKLARLEVGGVCEEVVYLMEQCLTEEEVDPKLGRVSYAAIALAEFVHAFFGLYKLAKGVQDYKIVKAHGADPSPVALPLSPPSNPRNDLSTITAISPVSTTRVPLTVPLPEEPILRNPTSVEAWLASLNLLQYLPAFHENEIDLDTLGLLSDKDLEDMGIPIGPKKKMIRSLANFLG
eukprot:TRINITY_DN6750_c0_g1_i1.p1 TRINITY_DN6750_c0_g1~~TRINITY_DN6750_c0_g1_i1.p1  ORF type:complete len:405 (+),score=112.77 TRINITY_DN6750_c0_g1_i1:104-1318(+)